MVAKTFQAALRPQFVGALSGHGCFRVGNRAVFFNDADAFSDAARRSFGDARASECSICHGSLLDHKSIHDPSFLVRSVPTGPVDAGNPSGSYARVSRKGAVRRPSRRDLERGELSPWNDHDGRPLRTRRLPGSASVFGNHAKPSAGPEAVGVESDDAACPASGEVSRSGLAQIQSFDTLEKAGGYQREHQGVTNARGRFL